MIERRLAIAGHNEVQYVAELTSVYEIVANYPGRTP